MTTTILASLIAEKISNSGDWYSEEAIWDWIKDLQSPEKKQGGRPSNASKT